MWKIFEETGSQLAHSFVVITYSCVKAAESILLEDLSPNKVSSKVVFKSDEVFESSGSNAKLIIIPKIMILHTVVTVVLGVITTNCKCTSDLIKVRI